VVPGEGFEPSVEDPKSSALPLGHPGSGTNIAFAPRIIPGRRVTSNSASALELAMRYALIGALLFVTVGCGAYAFPGGSSPSPNTGFVSGRVLAYPCAPVERVDSPCPGRPVAGVEIDYLSGTSVAARTVTDSNGNYSIRLVPGTYTVRFNNYMRVISGPTKLTVAAGSSLVAVYLLDSGIRAPVSQQ
jgi:carboxypeptidase family protein